MKPSISDVSFSYKNRKVKFSLLHNLTDLMNPLEAWLARTEEFTAQSFCAYVNSKKIPGVICREFLPDPQRIASLN